MKRFFLIIMIMIIGTSVSAVSAEKVLLFRFRSTGVDEQLLDAVDQVFADALSGYGVYSPVRAYEVVGNVQCHTPACASGYAGDAGYDKTLIGSLTRFGDKIIVNTSLVDSETGEVIHRAEGSSETVEDLDIVVKRLAKSISTGKTVSESAEVGMITEKESSPERRRSSFTTKGIRAGFLWTLDNSFGKPDRMPAIDFVVQHDMPDYFLSGKFGIKWGSGSWAFTWLHTKVGRYFGRGDFSPFISAGLGLESVNTEYEIEDAGFTREKSDKKTGFTISAGTGFALFKTYDYQFQLDLDYYMVLEKMAVGDGEEEYPRGILLTFCLKY